MLLILAIYRVCCMYDTKTDSGRKPILTIRLNKLDEFIQQEFESNIKAFQREARNSLIANLKGRKQNNTQYSLTNFVIMGVNFINQAEAKAAFTESPEIFSEDL